VTTHVCPSPGSSTFSTDRGVLHSHSRVDDAHRDGPVDVQARVRAPAVLARAENDEVTPDLHERRWGNKIKKKKQKFFSRITAGHLTRKNEKGKGIEKGKKRKKKPGAKP
jgi:hypothetical protein